MSGPLGTGTYSAFSKWLISLYSVPNYNERERDGGGGDGLVGENRNPPGKSLSSVLDAEWRLCQNESYSAGLLSTIALGEVRGVRAPIRHQSYEP